MKRSGRNILIATLATAAAAVVALFLTRRSHAS
jgi:hypothetical protein